MEIFAQWTALAALGVVVVQQILKLNVIPVYFANKYPVVTNVILSIVASVIVNGSAYVDLDNVWKWVAYVSTVSVIAAITYNMTLRNSPVVQRMARKGSPNVIGTNTTNNR